jgi:hypothetical protein
MEENKPAGGGLNIFWGTVFTLIALIEFYQKMLVIGGVPVWGLALLIVGLANYLKAPRLAAALARTEKGRKNLAMLANILNIAGLAFLVISIAVVYLG